MAETIMAVQNLVKYFPVSHGMFTRGKGLIHAVDDVSLSILGGETFGLVGESGCGKSTLSRVLLRLIEADSGRILFMGNDIRNSNRKQLKAQRAQMRMVFQNPYASLNPRESVLDIVSEPYRIADGYDKAQIRREVFRLLDSVGLSKSYANRYPHEFSGGQRQRIGIARAIAMNPRFIVCDEPVSALDVSIQAQILNLLRDIQKEFKLTYLFISHNLGVVRYMSDRIAVMYLGKIVEVADAHELYHKPFHPYTQALLSAIPGGTAGKRIILTGDVPSPVDPPSGCRFRTRCPFAYARCAEEAPVLREICAQHCVACHLADERGAVQ